MGWAVGQFEGRDIGYGVPAICDHPGCDEEIDRGLGYVCGGIFGEDGGCGRFFCMEHGGGTLCERCEPGRTEDSPPPFEPKPDVPKWIRHKLFDESWQQWRTENPERVEELFEALPRQEDPAVEAYEYAEAHNDGWPWDTTKAAMIEAARAALVPLRLLHRPYDRPVSWGNTQTERVCHHCLGPRPWPCTTALYIYSKSELS